MEPDSRQPLDTPTKYKIWLVIVLLAVVHLLAYRAEFTLPHGDLYYVIHVINALWQPGLYGGDWFTEFLLSFHPTTAPIYYYGLTYPLRFVLPAKWVILTIGFVITLCSAYFAGVPWTHWKHALVSLFLVVVLLTVNVSPLEGNKRSFTAFFVLGALALGRRPRYAGMLFLTALAAGVYAPMGLTMIAYAGVTELDRNRGDLGRYRESVVKLLGLCAVFLVVLTPYWTKILFDSGNRYVRGFVDVSQYSPGSLAGILKSFVLGSRGTHYGALFVRPEHLSLFLIVASLCLLQSVVLRDRFEFDPPYRRMILAVLSLWVLAHLVFPLIYFPFKYTRLSLALALAFPAVGNLPATFAALRKFFRDRWLSRLFVHGLGLVSLVALAGFKLGLFGAGLRTAGADWWEFLFVLPGLLSLGVIRPGRGTSRPVRSFFAVLLIGGLVFLPHRPPRLVYRGAHVSQFSGLFRVLQKSPPGSTIAGPPDLMQAVPAFGRRPIYNAPDWRTNDVFCRRNEAYWNALFASSPDRIRSFMVENGIDYFLVDRLLLKQRDYFGTAGCIQTFGKIDTSDPYLDRWMGDVLWRSRGGRFYVITPERLAGR